MKVWAYNEKLGSGDLNANFAELLKMLNPIGSIIPFYDFDGALTFNGDYYAYCNGQSKNIGGSSRTLPDLSGRYLVGFGTDGGADIDSATWATASVGNASHTNSHTHAGPSHTHTGPSHTHAGPSHTHSGSTISACINPYPQDDRVDMRYVSTSSWTANRRQPYGNDPLSTVSVSTSVGIGCVGNTGAGGTGNTGAGGTGNTGASGTGNTGVPSITSIQPSSIRVRYLMRIL